MLLRTTSGASGSSRAAFIRLLTLLVAFLVTSAAAADNQGGPTILNNTSKYAYLGCYNETSGLANTSGARTLDNGINKVWPGNMTVEACLKVCETSGSSPYKYAGLEFSRECWCSQVLNSNADKFPDSTCNLGCDGNSTIVCGGNLKLTVYQLSAAHSVQIMYGVSTLILVGAVALNLL